jgi:uncharacterized protein YndB with AHSA1/START domain
VTEIRVDVDLAHPPERVWRAFTEARVVTEWLATTRFVLTEDGHFTIRPSDLAGLDEQIDGQIVTTEAPQRLVMRWEAPNLHTLVSVTLKPTPVGCRLSLAQRGFLGPQGTMRRRVLHRTYTELFKGPLATSLERLAVEEAHEAAAQRRPDPAKIEGGRRNIGRAFQRLRRQADGHGAAPPRSASAPGLTSHVRTTTGQVSMPGFAAALLSAQEAAEAERQRTLNDVDGEGRPVEGEARLTGGEARSIGVVRVAEVVKLAELVQGADRRDGPHPFWRVLWIEICPRAGVAFAELAAAGWERIRRPANWSSERRSQAMAASAALLLLLAMVALLLGRATAPQPAGPPQVGGAERDPMEASVSGQPRIRSTTRPSRLPIAPGGPSAPGVSSALPSAAASTPSTGQPSSPVRAQAVDPALSAAYRTESTRVSGYDASITIKNDTTQALKDWSVIVTLPLLDVGVHDVAGAVATQNGNEMTFTPVDATRTVPAGSTVRLTFQVDGLGKPTACAVDGRPCSGVPE